MKLQGKRILILGATSGIAQQFGRQLVERRCQLVLVARNEERLSAVESDLRARGAETACLVADLSHTAEHAGLLERAWKVFGGIDLAFVAYGVFAEYDAAEEPATLLRLLETNFVSAAHLTSLLARKLSETGGKVAVITSVAGDRGRKRNYVYGSAKAGLSIFLQGLDHKHAGNGLRIVDIKLGMADTPMTAHLPASPLMVSAKQAVDSIVAGLERDQTVIYAPRMWRWIMLTVRAIPRPLMNRLNL
jgi:short-subunit dehydrogenase